MLVLMENNKRRKLQGLMRNALHGMSVPKFCNLIEKIESVHESLCKDIQDSFQMPEVCRLWIKSKEEER
jgi:tRNA:m4X modification enzyme